MCEWVRMVVRPPGRQANAKRESANIWIWLAQKKTRQAHWPLWKFISPVFLAARPSRHSSRRNRTAYGETLLYESLSFEVLPRAIGDQ